MKRSITFIFDKPPYGNIRGRELLDILLINAAFEQDITALFIGSGVTQLLDQQQPRTIGLKNHSATFKALPLYDVENIIVESAALKSFDIDTEDLLMPVKVMDSEAIADLLAVQDQVVNL